jgi:signal transduction histidine kinase
VPGQQDSLRWQVNGWSLRTKVAVVLLLPAAVALVLGGLRVQSRLDDASRLSTVRDQLGVLRDSVTLSDQVSAEMVAAVTRAPDLDARKSAVDERAAAIRRAADFAHLPAEVGRTLNDSLGRLSALRLQAQSAVSDPITQIAGYLEVANGLSDLVPELVSPAEIDELDRTARAVTSLLRLRAVLGTEETLLKFGAAAPANPAIAAAAQRVAAEESIIAGQIQRDLPAGNNGKFEAATKSAQARRDALQAAVSGSGTAALIQQLPELTAESAALDGLRGELVNALADNVSARTNEARSAALRDASIVLGALLAALAIALIVARSLLSPVRRLRSAALNAAHHQLPETVERVRAGERVDWQSVEPVPVHTGEEIGQLARAFDDMHRQAVRLAGEQAELRRQVSEMFMTLSRRSQSLVELQLEAIEELEHDEDDPQRLGGLFRLDHLATRLRRNGENLQVLAGGSPARRDHGPVTVVELLRAATSEVTDYTRISLGHAPAGGVRTSPAADVVHILAELLENATRFSPPDRKVVLTADRGADGGLLIEVVDGGLGMAAEDLAAANGRLAAEGAVGPETTRRMGLFVISRLAARHGVTVRLRPTYESASRSGITASVHLPAGLIIADGTPGAVLGGRPRIPEPAPAPEPSPAAVPQPAVSSWFTDVSTVDDESVGPVLAPAPRLMSPPEKTWRAADALRVPEPARTTAAGLPMRKPGARVVPAGPGAEPPAARIQFRNAESIRSNLSRHYNGVRAARERTGGTRTDGNGSEGGS